MPRPKSTLALEVPPFAVMMSSMPSRFTSPKVTEVGAFPVAKMASVLKVPLPLPNNTLTLLEVPFAVTISSMPSLSTSPKVTEVGLVLVPVVKVVPDANEGKAVMVGKSTRFTPRVPVPVMPVTFTV